MREVLNVPSWLAIGFFLIRQMSHYPSSRLLGITDRRSYEEIKLAITPAPYELESVFCTGSEATIVIGPDDGHILLLLAAIVGKQV